jgi:hypothetical protein
MLTYVFLMIEFGRHRANEFVDRINATVVGSKQAEKGAEVEADGKPPISDASCVGGAVDDKE